MKGGQLSCTLPTLRSQIWISFLKMLAFAGKWVGFTIPSLEGSRSERIANVPTKLLSLSFDAREFSVHSQRKSKGRGKGYFPSDYLRRNDQQKWKKKKKKTNLLTQLAYWLDVQLWRNNFLCSSRKPVRERNCTCHDNADSRSSMLPSCRIKMF